jgi:hypothetical protein
MSTRRKRESHAKAPGAFGVEWLRSRWLRAEMLTVLDAVA